jgi:DnaK suppressor protein
MDKLTPAIVSTCKQKLLETKTDIINRLRLSFREFRSRDTGGDETDQAVDMLAEGEFLTHQDRLRSQLLDIEIALAKIESGRYGLCEETEEPIEVNRLLAIPWTRLSIEGAEIREELSKRFAK